MIQAALGWLYPAACPLCERVGFQAPCEDCRSDFEPRHEAVAEDPEGPLAFRTFLYAYEGRAGQAVRRLKYSRTTELAPFMARSLAAKIRELTDPDTLIVPVPIHPLRLAERGFNQSELLAQGPHDREVAHWALRRVRFTVPQASLSFSERMDNLRDAFRADPRVHGRKVLLVDDVLTTGETARQCARALTAEGASQAGVIAFAGE